MRFASTSLLLGFAAFVSPVAGCSSGVDDSGAQSAEANACVDPTFRFASGTDGHHDPLGAAAARQSRAGKITRPTDIVQPVDARHKIHPGDFVLANEKIAVYIEAESKGTKTSDGYFPFGGEILAIEPVGVDGKPLGVSHYGETTLLFGLQTIAPDTVSVIADGSDGKAAIVRVSGTLKLVPLLDVFIALFPDQYGFPIALDYVLEPGATHVTTRYSIANTRGVPVDFTSKTHLGAFQSSRSQSFTPSAGFAPSRGDTPFVAWDNGRSSFLVRSQLGSFQSFLSVTGLEVYNSPSFAVGACEKKTVDYLDVVVGGPEIDGLLEAKRTTFGEPAWRELHGVVREQSGAPLAGALVHATSADGYLTRVTADAHGAFTVHVPPGPVELTPTLLGWAVPAAKTITDQDSSAELVLPQRATLDIDATDADTHEALPVRVQVVPDNRKTKAPPSFGLEEQPDDRLYREFVTSGHVALPVPPGGYRVIVTRGYEYEVHDAPVLAEAGKTAKVTAVLKHSVDSSGVMCGDFHIHSFFSADSRDPVEYKVRGAIADGLEIPVSTEHEYVIDFQPVIQQLGLTKWAFGIASEELTTFKWGHFGVFPLTPDASSQNNGAIESTLENPPTLFPKIAARPDHPLFIVNHPRGDTGYFDLAGFDRATGTSNNKELWSDVFGAIEVFNDSDFEKNRDASVADWFAFLNAGRKVPAVGSSDSHELSSSPVGYPRTCMRFGHDDPRRLTPGVVRNTLAAGASVVSGGLTMTVEGPGGIAPGGTSTAGRYNVVVASPSWLAATSLEVIVDGITTQTITIDPASGGPGPGHRHEIGVDVTPMQSKPHHWVVFHAKGSGDLAPLHPGRNPFAASNAIYF